MIVLSVFMVFCSCFPFFFSALGRDHPPTQVRPRQCLNLIEIIYIIYYIYKNNNNTNNNNNLKKKGGRIINMIWVLHTRMGFIHRRRWEVQLYGGSPSTSERAAYVDPLLAWAGTLLSLPAWQHRLRRHPDKDYVAFTGAAEAPEKWSGQSSQSFLKKVYA